MPSTKKHIQAKVIVVHSKNPVLLPVLQKHQRPKPDCEHQGDEEAEICYGRFAALNRHFKHFEAMVGTKVVVIKRRNLEVWRIEND